MREDIMYAVDSAKIITIARDSMKGSVSKNNPFRINEKNLAEGIKTATPVATGASMKQLAGSVAGVKTLKISAKGIQKLQGIKNRVKKYTVLIKKVMDRIRKLIGTGVKAAGKCVKVTGKTAKVAGHGTKDSGTVIDSMGDGINVAAEASAAIPVADVVTVPTGLTAGTAVKGAGTIAKGIGKIEEISGEGIEKAGRQMEKAGKGITNAGGMITDNGFSVADKVCKAMKHSVNPATRFLGTTLGGTVKAGRYASRATNISISKMTELASKGFDKEEEQLFVK